MVPERNDGLYLIIPNGCICFTGIELVGLTAGETEDPEKVIPMAINNIPLRIIFILCGLLGYHHEYLPLDGR